MHNNNDGFGIFVLICVSFIFGIILGVNAAGFKYKSDAVKRGFAQYNQTTGSWEWKESIKK